MFISVIPTSKSLSKHPYTYFVPEIWEDQVTLGGLVEAPVGKHLIMGIIAEQSYGVPSGFAIEDIRLIHQVVSSTPLLTKAMIANILFIADRYFLPIHKALSLFLPSPLMSRLEKRHYVLDRGRKWKDAPQQTLSIHHFMSRIFSLEDLDTYMENGSIIIFPNDLMLDIFMKAQKKDPSTLLLYGSSTPTKKSQAWIDIYEGKYERIVGTRRLLYYNLSAYKSIIYIEDAFGHEHYQYPITIKSLDALRGSATSHEVIIVTSSPTLELFATFQKAKIITKK